MNLVFQHAYAERQKLFKIGKKYFNDSEKAKDSVQGYLCLLLEKQPTCNTNLDTYVVTGFYNYCHNLHLSSAKYVLIEAPEQTCEQSHVIRDLDKLFDKAQLAPKQKRVIMAQLQGYKTIEIARKYKADYNTTKANVRHAVASLKECL